MYNCKEVHIPAATVRAGGSRCPRSASIPSPTSQKSRNYAAARTRREARTVTSRGGVGMITYGRNRRNSHGFVPRRWWASGESESSEIVVGRELSGAGDVEVYGRSRVRAHGRSARSRHVAAERSPNSATVRCERETSGNECGTVKRPFHISVRRPCDNTAVSQLSEAS
jgi:hypothetical protein